MERRRIARHQIIDESQELEQMKIKKSKDYISAKSISQNKSKNNFEDINLLDIISQEHYKQYCQAKSRAKQNKQLSKESQAELAELRKYIQLKKNICVLGSGSKISLLRELKRSQLSDRHIWEVKGYLSSVNLRKIYNHFGQFLVTIGVAQKITKLTVKDQLVEYRQALERINNIEIAIIFHSLDGPNLLAADVQKSLSALFSLPHIQLITSIDNMKIVMSWSPITVEKYKFIFFTVDTMVDYYIQQQNRPQDIQKKEKSENALAYIYQCLNNNQKQILRIIAKNQIQNMNRIEESNYTASQLFDICVDEIILSEDSQLRQNLLELLDHKVITQKFDEKKNKKVFVIKYDKKILEKMVNGTLGS